MKEFVKVMKAVSDGSHSPYTASLLGNLKHWLQDDPEIFPLIEDFPGIDREFICRRQSA
jgi:hypothetical protein